MKVEIIWRSILVLGVVIEVILGLSQLELNSGNKTFVEKSKIVPAAGVALVGGVFTSASYVKYCVKIPNWFLGRLGVCILMFAGMVAGAVLLIFVFFFVSSETEKIAEMCGYRYRRD